VVPLANFAELVRNAVVPNTMRRHKSIERPEAKDLRMEFLVIGKNSSFFNGSTIIMIQNRFRVKWGISPEPV
jgi:hypothetical protein